MPFGGPVRYLKPLLWTCGPAYDGARARPHNFTTTHGAPAAIVTCSSAGGLPGDVGRTLRLTSRSLLLLLRNQQQQPHRQVQQPNRTPPRGELLRSFLHQSSAATQEVLQNATNKLRPTSVYRQREYIHHHVVGVVGRATFRDIPAAVDMDAVSAPGGRNIIHIHVPGGLPGSSPADLGRAPRGGPSSGGVYFSTAYLNRRCRGG